MFVRNFSGIKFASIIFINLYLFSIGMYLKYGLNNFRKSPTILHHQAFSTITIIIAW